MWVIREGNYQRYISHYNGDKYYGDWFWNPDKSKVYKFTSLNHIKREWRGIFGSNSEFKLFWCEDLNELETYVPGKRAIKL